MKVDEKCLCDTCECVRYRTFKNDKGEELRGYDCPYSDEHIYSITQCNHYSNPGPIQKFFRNTTAVVCSTLLLIGIMVFVGFLIFK